MTPDSRGRQYGQYVSEWWFRAPFFAFMATRLVMLLTGTEHTVAGTIVETVLLAAFVACGIVAWLLHRRRKTAAEQARSTEETPQ